MTWEIKKRFTGEVMLSGDGELRHADLSGADLSGAYLQGADLSGANLSGAKIDAHTLTKWLAQIRRSDGYEFIAFATDAGDTLIRAGCRTMTLPEYRAHVATEYPDTDKARETTRILDFIEGSAK